MHNLGKLGYFGALKREDVKREGGVGAGGWLMVDGRSADWHGCPLLAGWFTPLVSPLGRFWHPRLGACSVLYAVVRGMFQIIFEF
jgi:hypothetical protein